MLPVRLPVLIVLSAKSKYPTKLPAQSGSPLWIPYEIIWLIIFLENAKIT